MHIKATFHFVVLLAVYVDAGRLIQEDPSWSKASPNNKPLVQEAPDDFVSRRHIRQQKVTAPTVKSIVTPQKIDTVAPIPSKVVSTAGTPIPRRKRKFPASVAPTPRNKRRGRKYEISEHRLMKYNAEAGSGKDAGTHGSHDPNSLFPLSKEMEAENEDAADNLRRIRQFPVWTTYPPHVLPLDRFFFGNETLTTPKYPYAKCYVSYGFETNPGCLDGEVCVDKDTELKVECPLTAGGTSATTCMDCSPGTPVSPCPRGCKPGKNCTQPSGPEDGLCSDPKRPEDDYDLSVELSSTKRTPMVFYTGTLGKGAACSVYGDLINEGQNNDLDFVEKTKKLRGSSDGGSLGGSMCNWAKARLECIPDKPRIATTTVAGTILTEADIEASKQPSGTCQCMLALGEQAVAVEDERTGNLICYIPANKGHHSNCDHEIYPPYGAIEGIRKDGGHMIRSSEPAAKFCVPNSECRAGYKYTGLRCQCKKKARWEPRTFTCSVATGLVALKTIARRLIGFGMIPWFIMTIHNIM